MLRPKLLPQAQGRRQTASRPKKKKAKKKATSKKTADAVPDRVPFLFTNEAMEFTGTLSFPHRAWLRDAMASRAAASDSTTTDEDTGTERDCDDPSHASPSNLCVTLGSDVLVSFYMTGVFGRVDEPNG